MYLQCTVYVCIHPAVYGMVVTCHSVTGREAISILYIHLFETVQCSVDISNIYWMRNVRK